MSTTNMEYNIDVSTPNDYQDNNEYYTDKGKIPAWVREACGEFFGMYIFILLSLGNVAIYALYPESKLSWDGLAISWGLNLTFGIYFASLFSKAHLNPAVTLCCYLFKKNVTLYQMVYYMVSQFLAAFLAAATIYGLYFNNIKHENDYSGIFTTYKNKSITDTTAFFTEFIGTALLVGGIFTIIHLSEKEKISGKSVPVFVGAWLTTLTYSLGFQTAFAWNPARDFGPRLFTLMAGFSSFSYLNYWWIPIVADFTGAMFGTLVFHLFTC
jgi:MIP family channel proteins